MWKMSSPSHVDRNMEKKPGRLEDAGRRHYRRIDKKESWGSHRHEKSQSSFHRRKIPDDGSHDHNPHATSLRETYSNLALNGNDSLVRKWLLEVDYSTSHDGIDEILRKRKDFKQNGLSITPLGKIPDFGAPEHLINANRLTKTKRRPNSSSDSSLLKEPVIPKPKKCKVAKKSETEKQVLSSASHRKDYEKRKRHKTRESRYETNKEPIGVRKEMKSRAKREVHGPKKPCGKPGDKQVNSFTSNSIGQERVTMRPSHGPGLFFNGRASSPAKRRGVPDLAFSEMDFLQRSSHQPPTINCVKIGSQRRDKEIYEPKVHYDKHIFSTTAKTPLYEISSNRTSLEPSRRSSSEPSQYRNCMEGSQQGQLDSRSPYTGIPESKHIEHGQTRQQCPHCRENSQLHPVLPSQVKLGDPVGNQMARSTSEVSWSDTQLSSQLSGTVMSTDDKKGRKTSSTPDSVRRSIEKTGVFRGIDRREVADSPRDHPSPLIEKEHHDGSLIGRRQNERREPTANPEAVCKQDQKRILGSRSEKHDLQSKKGSSYLQSGSGETEESQVIHHLPHALKAICECQQDTPQNGPKAMHLAPVSEKHQRARSKVHAGCSSAADKVESRPSGSGGAAFSRKQRAKIARINLPATKLPTKQLAHQDDPVDTFELSLEDRRPQLPCPDSGIRGASNYQGSEGYTVNLNPPEGKYTTGKKSRGHTEKQRFESVGSSVRDTAGATEDASFPSTKPESVHIYHPYQHSNDIAADEKTPSLNRHCVKKPARKFPFLDLSSRGSHLQDEARQPAISASALHGVGARSLFLDQMQRHEDYPEPNWHKDEFLGFYHADPSEYQLAVNPSLVAEGRVLAPGLIENGHDREADVLRGVDAEQTLNEQCERIDKYETIGFQTSLFQNQISYEDRWLDESWIEHAEDLHSHGCSAESSHVEYQTVPFALVQEQVHNNSCNVEREEARFWPPRRQYW